MSGRVAIILPVPYRGGTLRAAKDVAHLLRSAAAAGAGEPLDVVFARPLDTDGREADLDDLHAAGIPVRSIEWRHADREQALRMAATSLDPLVRPIAHDLYCYPIDGGANLLDCDFWLFFSDRVAAPLLPLRRYGTMVFDCLQRYVPETMTTDAWHGQRRALLPFIRDADVVLTTTPVTANDVQSFVGVPRARIRQIPMFFTAIEPPSTQTPAGEPYLVWVTNHSRHKNHLRTLEGLERYYERYDGRLRTIVIGMETKYFRARTPHPVPVVEDYVGKVRRRIAESSILRRRITIEGEVSDRVYAERLAGAHCLLHSCLYDNGTFSVLDAAALGVPAISSRYPAIEYMNDTFGLNLAWFDPFDPNDLARQLAAIERAAPQPASREHILQLEERHRAGCGIGVREAIAPWLTTRP